MREEPAGAAAAGSGRVSEGTSLSLASYGRRRRRATERSRSERSLAPTSGAHEEPPPAERLRQSREDIPGVNRCVGASPPDVGLLSPSSLFLLLLVLSPSFIFLLVPVAANRRLDGALFPPFSFFFFFNSRDATNRVVIFF